jgi:hypothetical protein
MFAETFANLSKATQAAVRAQEEAFKKWVGLCQVAPLCPAGFGDPYQVRKEWAEIVGELTRKQCQALEAQFGAGVRVIDEVLHLTEVKDGQELGTRAIELWQKTWDCLRQTCDAHVRDCQAAVARGAKLLLKPAAPHVAGPGPQQGAA